MSPAGRGLEFQPAAFRRTSNLILGVASEIASPLLRPLTRLVSKGPRSEPRQWRKGLILGHNHIGDVLYRTSSLDHLSRGLPDCEWSYLVSPASAEILKGNPGVQEILPYGRGLDAWDVDSSHRTELAERRFDVVLCTNTLRHYPDFLFASWLGIPNRAGFIHKGLSGLINWPVPMHFPSPYPAYFRSMVAALTGDAPDWSLTPKIFLSREDHIEAEEVLQSLGESDAPLLACSLTTGHATGNWPVSSMLAIIREARQAGSFRLLLCGTASDAVELNAIAGELGGDVHVLAGRLSLRGFAAMLNRCAALFCPDSGPRHIANAVGIPAVFTRNMSSSQTETGKYCATETDIAPAGEYLTDAEIESVAARTPVRELAMTLLSVIQSAEKRS